MHFSIRLHLKLEFWALQMLANIQDIETSWKKEPVCLQWSASTRTIMSFTTFFKIYKIYALLHRSKLFDNVDTIFNTFDISNTVKNCIGSQRLLQIFWCFYFDGIRFCRRVSSYQWLTAPTSDAEVTLRSWWRRSAKRSWRPSEQSPALSRTAPPSRRATRLFPLPCNPSSPCCLFDREGWRDRGGLSAFYSLGVWIFESFSCSN